jgi:very-short-patch-repair endonuclease
VNRARYLRRNPTRYEKILWRRLRNRNFATYKFRRQHPLDRYILDFYCSEAQLAIELDGGGHNYIEREMHDEGRTKFLATQGIFVLRFWNHQLRENLDSVLEAIWFELERRCGANPSPQSSPFEKGRGRSR